MPDVLKSFCVTGAMFLLILLINPSSLNIFVKTKNGNSAGKMLVAHTLIPVKQALIEISGDITIAVIIKIKKIDIIVMCFFKKVCPKIIIVLTFNYKLNTNISYKIITIILSVST